MGLACSVGGGGANPGRKRRMGTIRKGGTKGSPHSRVVERKADGGASVTSFSFTTWFFRSMEVKEEGKWIGKKRGRKKHGERGGRRGKVDWEKPAGEIGGYLHCEI